MQNRSNSRTTTLLVTLLCLVSSIGFMVFDPTRTLVTLPGSRGVHALRYLTTGLIGASGLLLLLGALSRLRSRAIRWIQGAVLSAFVLFVGLNGMLKWKFDLFVGDRIFAMLKEPGILEQITIGPFHFVLLAVLFVVLTFAFKWALEHLRWNRLEAVSSRGILIVVSILAISIPVERLLSSRLLFQRSYQVRLQFANVPFYRTFEADGLWNALGYSQSELDIVEDYHSKSLEHQGLSHRLRHVPLPRTVTAEKTPNILFVFMESIRGDLLDPEVMPNLWSLAQAKGAFTGAQHYSIGNSTAESLFGGLSGQTALYWYQSKTEGLYPQSLTLLRRLGYQANLFYTSKLDYRQINRYVFNANELEIFNFIQAKDRHFESRESFKGSALETDDMDMVEAFEKHSIAPEKQLDILYFYSGHYNYYYPEAYAKFQPALSREFGMGSLGLESDAPLLKNRYKNSAHFVDAMLGRVIEKLKRENVFDQTLIVVIGDHGEELFEFGKVGHSTALNEYQTRTPFVMKAPTPVSTRYKITSHADIMPSVLSYMGVDVKLEDYFSGKNLFSYSKEKDSALILNCLRKEIPLEFAYVTPDHKVFFDNQASRVVVRKVTDLKDRVLKSFPAQSLQEDESRVIAAKRHFVRDADEPKQKIVGLAGEE